MPHLDEVYTLARYLMRNAADADDAVQECYLRALRHFDSYRGPAMKPWLLAILRNVCNAEFARRTTQPAPAERTGDEPAADEPPLWQEPQRRRKRNCSAVRTAKRSAGSSPRCRSSSAKPSCCVTSTICRIAISPKSRACRSER